jgi:hypothetical protein
MTDPLSAATRSNKRNLLIVSVLAISASAFNVSIDKIPVGGLSITFDSRLFAFLLLITLVYFLCTFILYYFIDIKNLKELPHQTTTEHAFREHVQGFSGRYDNRVRSDLNTIVPPHYSLSMNYTFTQQSPAREFNPGFYALFTMDEKDRSGMFAQMVDRSQDEGLHQTIDDRLRYWIKCYKRAERLDWHRGHFVVTASRAVYFMRNYFIDGMLPIMLGFFALITILGHIDLTWIQNYLPSFKALSSKHFSTD